MDDACTIVAIGLIALFGLLMGAIALALFGLGAIVYGMSLLPEQPVKGVGLIVVGFAILGIFSRDSRRPFR